MKGKNGETKEKRSALRDAVKNRIGTRRGIHMTTEEIIRGAEVFLLDMDGTIYFDDAPIGDMAKTKYGQYLENMIGEDK